MHHHFQFKFLVEMLHHLGFSCSYSEVQRFEQNAAVGQGSDIPNFSPAPFAADNVDHNIDTIDEKGTFHSMGLRGMITPEIKIALPVKRLNKTAQDIIRVG